jgi:hypothetical protein
MQAEAGRARVSGAYRGIRGQSGFPVATGRHFQVPEGTPRSTHDQKISAARAGFSPNDLP